MKRILRRLTQFLPDKLYLQLLFRKRLGRSLNLKDPRTFNEKLQWLKLYDRKPEYTTMVDKAAVKDYVAGKIGGEYLIPTLGLWDNFDDIDFDALPDRFVLKCTHDSGGLVICRDKEKLNRDEARKKIEKSLATNYYYHGREWPYKNVKPRILAEEYLQEDSGDLRDYKLMCFNGEPRCILVCAERSSAEGVRMSFFDPEWNLLPMKRKCPRIQGTVEKPETLLRMLSLARELARDIPFARVDFYDVNGQIYFGEITFFPASGFGIFEPECWDAALGSWLSLPERN